MNEVRCVTEALWEMLKKRNPLLASESGICNFYLADFGSGTTFDTVFFETPEWKAHVALSLRRGDTFSIYDVWYEEQYCVMDINDPKSFKKASEFIEKCLKEDNKI